MFWRSKNLRKTKKAKKTYAFQKKRLKSTVFGVTFNPPQWYDKEKGLQKAGHASARQKNISEKFSEKKNRIIHTRSVASDSCSSII